MALTTQQIQRSNALIHYSEALKNTRASYLSLLKTTEISKEDTNAIWNASFTLQYMITSHQKYIDQLKLLKKDKRALAIIGRFYDQLTIDPAQNLQGFIDEAQTILQSEAFKAELLTLKDAYSREIDMLIIGSVLVFVAPLVLGGILAASVALTTSVSLPIIIVAAFITSIIHTYLGSKRDEVGEKCGNISFAVRSFSAKEPEDYSLSEEYSFQTFNSKNNSSSTVTFSKDHQPRLKTELRQSFFQSQMVGHEALHVEVQSQFNLLTN